MMHFMGFDLSSERKYAAYGQMSEMKMMIVPSLCSYWHLFLEAFTDRV